MAGYAKKRYTWYYYGVKVTRKWLDFNCGVLFVNNLVSQADVFFRTNPRGVYDFGNGISVSC